MVSNKIILQHLLLIKNIGPHSTLKLLAHAYWRQYATACPDDLVARLDVLQQLSLAFVYDYSIHDFIHQVGLGPKISEDLFTGLHETAFLERELYLMEQNAFQIASIFDETYPEYLRYIHLPPSIFYYKGAQLASQAKRIAFVGARKADQYGKKVTDTLVAPLVQRGWEIISGGAFGADAFAHQAALDVCGKTTAVLGSGLLRLYPKENFKLFNNIIEGGGTLLSIFALQAEPERGHFPARNRIIAGLSQGCIVVQAAAKSGALITAEFALEQGRTVFAIPGSIFDPLSKGCHALLGQGAKVVMGVENILEEFGEDACQSIPLTYHQVDIQSTIISPPTDPILAYFKGAHSADELCVVTGLGLEEMQNKLFELQLDGKVQQTFSGLWECTR